MPSSQGYFVWDIDPVIFTIPQFRLPVPLSIWGLIAGAVLLYFAWQKWIPQDEKARAALPFWKPWGIVLGSLLIGQIPFLFLGGPAIETFGPIQPRYYGLMFACAFIFGYLVAARIFLQGGRTHEEIDRLLIYILVATVVGARLGHIIFYDLEYYLRNPHLIPAIWRGGLASHGAAIAIILAMWLYVKKTPRISFYWLADRVVPSVALGGMFIRIGNFFNSEILGKATDLPWAIIFPRGHVENHVENPLLPRHPSMLYESLSALLIFLILMGIYHRYDKRPPEGSLFGTFLVLLFTGRFLIEFTKLPQSDFEAALILNMGQLLSIPLVLFGLWLVVMKVEWRGAAPARTAD